MKQIFALVVVFFLLTSCVYQRFPGIADPSRRMDIVSGVSVLPPQEPNWKILQMSSFQLALGKQGPQPDATYAVVAILYKLPDFDTEEQFLKKVSEGRLSEPETGRFKFVKNDVKIFRGREAYCVRYHSISEDQAARIGAEKKSMLLEMIGFHCQHPKNKRVGVNFEYSHRHYPGDEDPEIEKKANDFLERIKFTDF